MCEDRGTTILWLSFDFPLNPKKGTLKKMHTHFFRRSPTTGACTAGIASAKQKRLEPFILLCVSSYSKEANCQGSQIWTFPFRLCERMAEGPFREAWDCPNEHCRSKTPSNRCLSRIGSPKIRGSCLSQNGSAFFGKP